jgi:hypothetical protein
MANELRVRQNFQSGTIDDNPLTSGATTLTSTELAGLAAVDSTEHMALVLDPTGALNGPEIVWVTAHTGSATTATIVRGREGTTGVQHSSVITWVHVATNADYEQIGPTADRPSGTGLPFKWQRYFDTDLGSPMIYNGSAWVQLNPEAATVATSETYTGSSYGDPATPGPAVTLTTGTKALVTVTAYMANTTAIRVGYMSFAVSGATTLAADDARAMANHLDGTVSPDSVGRISAQVYLDSLTAGVNVFTAQYRSSQSNAFDVANRTISVTPLL